MKISVIQMAHARSDFLNMFSAIASSLSHLCETSTKSPRNCDMTFGFDPTPGEICILKNMSRNQSHSNASKSDDIIRPDMCIKHQEIGNSPIGSSRPKKKSTKRRCILQTPTDSRSAKNVSSIERLLEQENILGSQSSPRLHTGRCGTRFWSHQAS